MKPFDRFGKLVAQVSLPNDWWRCRCDCGRLVTVRETKLTDTDGVRSCGCANRHQQSGRPQGKQFSWQGTKGAK